MPQNPTIALDAMGGDHGPRVLIEGAEIARVRHPDLRYFLYGQESAIAPELSKFPKLAECAQIVHTDDVVLGTDKPSQALRRSRTSSMGLAIESVKAGACDVAVSAGNTGALMAMAKFLLRTSEGIDRPALIAVLPNRRGESVMLDLGANVDCNADNLLQFAIMGAAFARTALGLKQPRVALLNIGVEELKGSDTLKDAAALLKTLKHIPMDFVGFVEGDKIGAGDVDVIVTDGFTGNIALKTAEGTAKFIIDLLSQAFRLNWSTKLGYLLARSGLRVLRDYLDPNNHNGAVFLGLNGLVVKSHGSANASGIATAISTARELVVDNIGKQITDDLAALGPIKSSHGAIEGAA
jgi:phosphate acyltransferase